MIPFSLLPKKPGIAYYESAFKKFLDSFPSYKETAFLDQLRKKEFKRLDKSGHVYLDFTGGGLYADSQVTEHAKKLTESLLGNPHSANTTSQRSSELTESARSYVLRFFNASPEEYYCIFTSNASGALKLLGESYPFAAGGHFLLTFDNHNSVNGIREFARSKGAGVTYSPIQQDDLRIDRERLLENLSMQVTGQNKLFAFPAQSNASGVKHDLEWISLAKKNDWDVLLDAAAYVPSSRLDLEKYKPDFVSISFYKIFGYPTGIGCLLVRKNAFDKLIRPWFAGGTITLVSVHGDAHSFADDSQKFEDGTINYLEIPAVEHGLKHMQNIGIENVGKRISALTEWTLQSLQLLKHDNGMPLIKIYGPKDNVNRGGNIAMNFYDNRGIAYDFEEIVNLAKKANISLRGGCFCNPGVDETNHSQEKSVLKKYFALPQTKSYRGLMQYTGKGMGSVRISFGYISNFTDAFRYVQFATGLLNKNANETLN